jgi:hypothetical protein
LQWRTSRQNTWHTEVGEVQDEQLKVGETFQLHVFISDCGSNYALSAMLKADDRPIQEGGFSQLDRIFSIDVNQFYDTIRQSVGKDTTLTAEIRKSGSDQLVAEVDVLRFGKRCDVS